MKLFCFLLCTLMGLAQPAIAQTLTINANNARLAFAGEHAGRTFDGVFNRWQSTLVLPPSDQPNIRAEFQLASAETGNAMYDESLPEADWFDVENTPRGVFVSDTITETANGFSVSGLLTLRGKANPVSFDLNRQGSGFKAQFAINRLDFDIGRESDPDAEWVSRDIVLTLEITP